MSAVVHVQIGEAGESTDTGGEASSGDGLGEGEDESSDSTEGGSGEGSGGACRCDAGGSGSRWLALLVPLLVIVGAHLLRSHLRRS